MRPLIRSVGAILGLIRAEYRQLYNRYFGRIERFEGDAKQICAQIIDRLWEGDFYRTSLGHFDFFWMRDFGTVSQSLVHLGYTERVHHTLHWIMRRYRRAGIVKQCVDKAGNVFNAPARKSIDALPWLFHSLVVSDYPLNKTEHAFLQKQLKIFAKSFLDPMTGNILQQRYAEMRDAVYYDRSAYSVALVGRMAFCANKLGLDFPYEQAHYRHILMRDYWNDDYFNADMDSTAFSSECALMPFFLKVVTDEKKMSRTFDYINKIKLNQPYPLKYGTRSEEFEYRVGMGPRLMPNYTGSSIWTWHGTFYLHLLKRYERPEYHTQYENFAAMIERHKTYPELLNPDGSWYKVPIYKSDPGMVWAALFLEL